MIVLHLVCCDDFIPQWHVSRRVTQTHIMILVAQGGLSYQFEERDVPLVKGDMLIIPAGSVNSGSNNLQPHLKYAVLFTFDSSEDDPISEKIGSKPYHLFKPRGYEYMRQRMISLHRAWYEKGAYYEMICQGITMEMLGVAYQEMERRTIPAPKLVIAKQVENYIIQHYKEELTIPEMALRVQRTPNYVTTIFKQAYGQTPIEYMHHTRITTAQNLLLHSNMNIAQISDFLGYCDPSYFNRVFKKITGQPPSELLKQRN